MMVAPLLMAALLLAARSTPLRTLPEFTVPPFMLKVVPERRRTKPMSAPMAFKVAPGFSS
ncbi:hypothetical protein D3C81_1974170 [compost metagenome]